MRTQQQEKVKLIVTRKDTLTITKKDIVNFLKELLRRGIGGSIHYDEVYFLTLNTTENKVKEIIKNYKNLNFTIRRMGTNEGY